MANRYTGPAYSAIYSSGQYNYYCHKRQAGWVNVYEMFMGYKEIGL